MQSRIPLGPGKLHVVVLVLLELYCGTITEPGLPVNVLENFVPTFTLHTFVLAQMAPLLPLC